MTLSEIIEGALAYSKVTKTEIGKNIFGISQPGICQKIKREKFTKKEMEQMAAAMGATYHAYFEFPDGTKIGD